MLVDSHCHLDFDDFAPERDVVIARAKARGVGAMLTIGTKLSAFDGVRAIAESHENIFCSVGVHPHEAESGGVSDPEVLIALTKHPKVVALGETGLDYYYEHSPKESQQTSFRAHIAAARATGLPLVIHTRNADSDMARILDEEMNLGAFTGVLHCFSSTAELARTALDLGLFISFSGIITFKNAEEVRRVADDVPMERLLVETDAPYLAPVPHRGKRNEPGFVIHTAEKLAEVKGVPVDQLWRQTTNNFFTVFSKAVRPASSNES